MKISFVIPAYNEENYLGKALQSILDEVRRAKIDYEIIVVNNASIDKTKELALSFPGVRVVDEMRKGLSFARQAGFSASSGDLIANIDADTIMPHGWINTVLKYFAEHPKLVALSGPHVFYDLPRRTLYIVKLWYKVAHLGNKHLFKKSSIVQGGNFVLTRAALEKIGGFNTDFNFYGEDTDIARRMRKVGEVIFALDLPIYASGRRIAEEGTIKMGLKYWINYIWTNSFARPFSKNYTDIRKDPLK